MRPRRIQRIVHSGRPFLLVKKGAFITPLGLEEWGPHTDCGRGGILGKAIDPFSPPHSIFRTRRKGTPRDAFYSPTPEHFDLFPYVFLPFFS